VETGSVPGKTKVKMSLTSPKGKKYTHNSEVDIRLTENLAKAKGVAIDKNGKLLKAGGLLEGDYSTLILLSVLGIVLLGGLMYVRRRKGPPEEEPEPEEEPAIERPAKRQKRK
jgi:hypothetical protein